MVAFLRRGLVSRTSNLVTSRSCNPRVLPASSRAPAGAPSVSQRFGLWTCLPHLTAIALIPWGRRSAACPGRQQITDFCSFEMPFLNMDLACFWQNLNPGPAMNVGGAGVHGRVKSPKPGDGHVLVPGRSAELLSSVSLLFRDSVLVLMLARGLQFRSLGKAGGAAWPLPWLGQGSFFPVSSSLGLCPMLKSVFLPLSFLAVASSESQSSCFVRLRGLGTLTIGFANFLHAPPSRSE